MNPMRRSFRRPGAGAMTRGSYPTSTQQAVQLLGGVQRVPGAAVQSDRTPAAANFVNLLFICNSPIAPQAP
jgi:hypothetical protein